MGKPEWGKKRICQSCGLPFYDLKKKSISCPKCGAAFDPTPTVKSKRAAQPVAAPKSVPAPIVAEEEAVADDEDVETLDDEAEAEDAPPVASTGGLSAKKAGGDEDDALIEDASDLGEDEDDIGEVKEHIDDGVADKP